MQLLKSKTENKINQFVNLVKQGVESWIQAGQLVVEILDVDPDAVSEICETCAIITPEIVARFEQIGRKQLKPELLLSDSPGYRRLREMPYSLQEKYSEQAVDVFVVNNGKTDTLRVPVKSLSGAQATQVFTRSGVRDIGAQRAFLLERNTRAFFPTLDSKRPYTVSGHTVCFKENCKLTRRQLLDIVAELK